MMREEFIERTGFEPTGEEYAAIEAEYMGGNDDKDTFCKAWKKNGGVQRLTRMRARKIEELESNVMVLEREKGYFRSERDKFRKDFHDTEKKVTDLEKENESLKASLSTLVEANKQYEKTIKELEDELAGYRKLEAKYSAIRTLFEEFYK